MPGKTAKDAPKTLPKAAQKVWASVFNSAWEGTCKKEGERRDECAARVAWAAVKRDYKESDDNWIKKSTTPGGPSICVCPDCKFETEKKRGEPCRSLKCPECGTELVAGNAATQARSQSPSQSLSSVDLEKVVPHGYLDFIVVKASSSGGEMRWVARASDTLKDDYDTRMSRQLFENFIKRARAQGKLPYLGVSHYGALGDAGIGGDCTSMWIDGIVFKAKGTFRDSSIGRALFGTVVRERNDPSISADHKARISIGFVDLKHSHGNFVFSRRSLSDVCPVCASGVNPTVYLDGQLIHFGVTRVPVNRRTTIDAGGHVMRSDQKITRRDDAASIIGDDLADELEKLTQAGFTDDELGPGQSQAMVVKADATDQSDQPAPTQLELDAQVRRSRRYGIKINDEGSVNLSATDKSPGIKEADFGDPVNFLFPIWLSRSTKELTPDQRNQIRDSSALFRSHAAKYDPQSRKRIAARIERSLKNHGERTKETPSAKVTHSVAYSADGGGLYQPFGGAVTLDEATRFLETQQMENAIVDEVDMFQAVVSNILTVPLGDGSDRGTALGAVADEFRDRIGHFASTGDEDEPEDQPEAEAEAEDEVDLAERSETGVGEEEETNMNENEQLEGEQAEEEQAKEEQAEEEVPESAPPTPAVVPAVSTVLEPVTQAITQFQSLVMKALGDPSIGPADRLKQIQPELEAMSKAIIETANTAPQTPQNEMVGAFRAALAEEMGPLMHGLQVLLAKIGEPTTSTGPARRTYSHVATTPASTPTISPVDALARRSVVGNQPKD